MRLWHLRIERFRGIAHLDWAVTERVTCLVGAGDQGKTTILDAIGALGSRRVVQFSESDFHQLDPDAGPIEIEAVLGDLPAELLADNRFGMDLIGVDEDGSVYDEPGGHQPGIRLRVDVDGSLEAVWRIFSARNPEGRLVSARDRAALNLIRIGNDPDRQFHLGRASAFMHLVGNADDVGQIVEAAYAAAREAVSETDLSALDPAVATVRSIGVDVGAGVAVDDLNVGLELSRTNGSGLSLQGAGIPIRAAGLGTRRLLAVGLELGSSRSAGLVCLDEIEHGLEPHRIGHLVRTLGSLVEPSEPGGPGGHVLFTTHSPSVLAEMGSAGVSVVRSTGATTSVRSVPEDMTGIVRMAPAALLSRRVLVAEGKTEVGLVRAYDSAWQSAHDHHTLAHLGLSVVDGGGSGAPERARSLNELGYPVLLLVDSDAPLNPSAEELAAAGVTVVQWGDAMCSEERVLSDLSVAGVSAAFDVVVDQGHDPTSVVAAILGDKPRAKRLADLGLDATTCGDSIPAVLSAGFPEADLREGFSQAAKRNSWFKRIDSGEALGSIAASDPAAATAPFGLAMAEVETWCHG